MRAMIAASCIALTPALCSGATIYVDADAAGANDGSSWADAYTDLSEALWSAESGDEVWVADGIYRPSRPADSSDPWTDSTNPRDAFFWIKRRVEVYGGFDGTESTLAERAGLYDSTILDGDIGAPGVFEDNVYGLVLYRTEHADTAGGPQAGDQTTPARFDGFTVRGANGSGGLRVNPTVASQNANLYIENITFTGNLATNGGGINYQAASSRPIRSCRFIGNHADLDGGGIFADPVANFLPIVDCVFEGNTAGDDGGGLFYKQGIIFDTAYLFNTVFRGNSANSTGGALCFNAQGSTIPLKIVNCEFAGNTAASVGGAVWVFGGAVIDPSVGAVILGSRVTCNNSTFFANNAGGSGGAVYLGSSDRTSAHINATNCIFWNNDAEIDATATPTAIISTSIVEHGWSGGGSGVLDADPLFLDAPADLRLASLSPAIDRGDTFNIPADYFDLDEDTLATEEVPFDLLGQGRRFDAWADDAPIVPAPVVDLGAHECRAACRADVNGDGLVGLDDLTLFINFFSAGDARGDMNGDGRYDLADIVVYVGSFSGCN